MAEDVEAAGQQHHRKYAGSNAHAFVDDGNCSAGKLSGPDLAASILRNRDTSTESIPLFLMVHDWRGVYTPRYTYSFAVPTKNPSWWNQPNFVPETVNRLFDRENDPLEMKNLFHDPAHRKLKDRLHEQTLAWMKRFQDTGLSYADIVSRVEMEDDLEVDKRRMLTREGRGLLKGRPLDYL